MDRQLKNTMPPARNSARGIKHIVVAGN